MRLKPSSYKAIRRILIADVGCENFNKIAKQCRLIIDNTEGYKCKYTQFWINKKNKEKIFSKKKAMELAENGGKIRPIKNPSPTLKAACIKINELLAPLMEKQKQVSGFVKERDVIYNAELHQVTGNNKYLMNLDLENAFNQVTQKNLKLFGRYVMSWNKTTSAKFARMMTINNQMVQGNPLSPTMLNLFGLYMDEMLLAYAKGNGLTYSRYADDLSFSSPKPITDINESLTISIIKHNGMKVNMDKRDFYKNLLEITGVRIKGKNYLKTCNRKKLKSDVRKLQWLINKRGYTFHKRVAKDGSPIALQMIINGCNNWINRQHSDKMKKRNFRMEAEIRFHNYITTGTHS